VGRDGAPETTDRGQGDSARRIAKLSLVELRVAKQRGARHAEPRRALQKYESQADVPGRSIRPLPLVGHPKRREGRHRSHGPVTLELPGSPHRRV
jgi:hypothetical protein